MHLVAWMFGPISQELSQVFFREPTLFREPLGQYPGRARENQHDKALLQ
jgi:hypothetical protein